MDNFIFFNEKDCKEKLNLAINWLIDLGFIVNLEKSSLEPSKKCTYLGFVINSETMTIQLTEIKRS